MVVDRPFLFAIIDAATGLPLFLGQVSRPGPADLAPADGRMERRVGWPARSCRRYPATWPELSQAVEDEHGAGGGVRNPGPDALPAVPAAAGRTAS